MPYGILKRPWLIAIVGYVGIPCLLWACAPFNEQSGVQAGLGAAAAIRTPGQVLPIAATVTLAGQVFELEVAKTGRQQALGLMYRTFLPLNRGMLFGFTPAQPIQFWMKHCAISLDMIFVRQGKVIAIAANTPPCKTDPCPVYGPSEPVDQVIEIQGGRAANIGLKVGANLEVQWLKIPR